MNDLFELFNKTDKAIILDTMLAMAEQIMYVYDREGCEYNDRVSADNPVDYVYVWLCLKIEELKGGDSVADSQLRK